MWAYSRHCIVVDGAQTLASNGCGSISCLNGMATNKMWCYGKCLRRIAHVVETCNSEEMFWCTVIAHSML